MIALLRLISLRYLRLKKVRLLLTLQGIALGVAMIVAVDLANQNVLGSYHRLLDDLAGKADLQVTGVSDSGIPEELLSVVSRVSGLEHVAPVVKGRAFMTRGERSEQTLVFGIDPEKDVNIRQYSLAAGRLPSSGQPEITLTKTLANDLTVHLGDTVSLLAPRGQIAVTVVGLLNDEGPGRANAGLFALLHLRTAQDALLKNGMLDSVDVVVRWGNDTEQVKTSLMDAVDGKATVGKPAERGQELQDLLQGLQFMLYFSAVMSIFVGLFIIFNNVMISIKERRAELGILRSLGLRRRTAFILVMFEALGLGIAGSLIGIALGVGMAVVIALGLSQTALALFDLKLGHAVLSGATALKALGYGVVSTLVAAYVPARETLRVQPLEAVRPAEVEEAGRGFWRQLGGVLLLSGGMAGIFTVTRWEGLDRSPLLVWGFAAQIAAALGAVFLVRECITLLRPVVHVVLQRVLGPLAGFAHENLHRTPSRTSATIAALMMSIAFMIGLSGFATSYTNFVRGWVDRTIAWDFRVSTGVKGIQATVPMDEDYGQQLKAVDGVSLASPQRFVFTNYGSGRILLDAFRMDEFSQYATLSILSGPAQPRLMAQLSDRQGIAITTVTERRYGLKVGDVLTLDTPSGRTDMQVLAVVDAFSPDTGEIYIDYDWYSKLWQDNTVDAFAVKVADTAKGAEVIEGLKSTWKGQVPLEIKSQIAFRQDMLKLFDDAFMQVKGLVGVTVAVAALGIINTMMVSVLERRREFAVTRALGASQRQVLRQVLAEAGGIGLYGAIMGVFAGVGMYWVVVSMSISFSGLRLVIEWPVTALAVGTLTALVAGPLAGLLPARTASRTSIVEALRYE